MITSYNHTTLIIKHNKADSIAIKGKETAVKIYDLIDGQVSINTDDYLAGEYWLQYFRNNEVIGQDNLIIKENLKYVSNTYDPRSNAQKILDAINAYLSGVATHQQRRIKCGQKQIQYSSYNELMQWKNYYESEVRKQQGKPAQVRAQHLTYRGL